MVSNFVNAYEKKNPDATSARFSFSFDSKLELEFMAL